MMMRKIWNLVLLALAVLAMAGAGPAMAQKKEDLGAEAQRDAKAEADAKMLRDEAARNKGKELAASLPLDPQNVWRLELSNGNLVRIQLRPDVAPEAVERIKALTRQHFYDGLMFHRVIDGFMAQGGDPKGDGTGGSSLPDLKAEFNWLPHMRGTVSMARAASEDSANSQFFIMLMPRTQLDHKYTVFGRVIEGMGGVDAISKGEPPAEPTKIVRATLEADNTALPAS
jgi:cyclophilin family peptidyl-prolyl cis-trans isomerase